MIPTCRCPYCQRVFQPSPYRLQQRVCSQPECQRRRRADYHRQKIRTDPLYAQVVRDSRKQWQAEHADYQKAYWQTQPRGRRAKSRATASTGSAAPHHQSPFEEPRYCSNRFIQMRALAAASGSEVRTRTSFRAGRTHKERPPRRRCIFSRNCGRRPRSCKRVVF